MKDYVTILSFAELLNISEDISEENKSSLIEAASQTTDYVKGLKRQPKPHPLWASMYQDWYDSLNEGTPDYSVYSRQEYLAELWSCWVTCSRVSIDRVLTSEIVYNDIKDCKKIVDLGCGFGVTTAYLKQLFPSAKVIGTNIKDTVQSQICSSLAKEYDFEVCYERKKIPDVDVIFASEYFEHFENPVQELKSVLRRYNPKKMIIANAFQYDAIGHFNFYFHERKAVKKKDMSKVFNESMRSLGFQKVKTNIWNERPQFWKK